MAAAACCTLTLAALQPRAAAAPLDPNAYASLGSLNVAAGSLTFDTSTLAISGAFTGTGVLQSQGAGLPDIAVFTFDDVTIAAGVTLSFTGSRPIAILSQGDATINGFITAAPFADAGLLGSGDGGAPGMSGGGPGGGGPTGGGGFGGAGGSNSVGFGGAYGDLATGLQAGSGGGGGDREGGAGGGAFEIGAVGILTLLNQIVVAGARGMDGPLGLGSAGGGGSGGGILLHGRVVTGSGLLDAAGGDGGTGGLLGGNGGGGGGGGRILAIMNDFIVGSFPVAVSSGGEGGDSSTILGQPGAAGVTQLMLERTVIPSGLFRQLDSDGTFIESVPGFQPFQTGDLKVNAGGLAFATAPVTSVYDVQLEGGLVAAPTGWTMAGSAQIAGYGTVAGPFSGGAGTSIDASGGTLVLGDANDAVGFDFAGAIQIATGAVLSLLDADGATLATGGTMTATGDGSVDGRFSNQGTVNGPTGGGQFLTFSDDVDGAGSYTGNILFSDGFSPGNSPAIVTLENVAFDATALLEIELDGTAPGGGYDQLAIAGDVSLDGTLSVVRNFVPDFGTEFDIITAASRTGTFDTYSGTFYNNGGLNAVLAHLYDFGATDGLVLRASLAGDANLDGAVDITDTLEIAANFNSGGASFNQGDLNQDGVVDITDMLEIAANFGNVVPVSASIAPIPEPATWLLSLMALAGLVWRGRRRAH